MTANIAEPHLDFVDCLDPSGLHRMAYWEWGARDNPRVVVCVHGLTRQGRDFDTLARALASDWRVVCPDVVGRGRSDWLVEPMAYQVPTYVPDIVTLLARLGADAVQRIGAYVGQPRRVASEEEAAEYLWSISNGFGPHSREQWLALTRPQLRAVDDAQGAGFEPHYDPNIGLPFRAVTPELAAAGEAVLWQRYDALRCQTLLIRGADSDLLSHETAQAMTRRGPKARLVELPGVGHAPTLVQAEQVALVREFLESP